MSRCRWPAPLHCIEAENKCKPKTQNTQTLSGIPHPVRWPLFLDVHFVFKRKTVTWHPSPLSPPLLSPQPNSLFLPRCPPHLPSQHFCLLFGGLSCWRLSNDCAHSWKFPPFSLHRPQSVPSSLPGILQGKGVAYFSLSAFRGCASTCQTNASRLSRGQQEFAFKEEKEDKRVKSSLSKAFLLWATAPAEVPQAEPRG